MLLVFLVCVVALCLCVFGAVSCIVYVFAAVACVLLLLRVWCCCCVVLMCCVICVFGCARCILKRRFITLVYVLGLLFV